MRDFSQVLQILRFQEGGLIELCIEDTEIVDWGLAITELTRFADVVTYKIDGVKANFDGINLSMFHPDNFGRYSITIKIGVQTWTTGMFSTGRVDFQGDPREVRDERDVAAIVVLMDRLRGATGKAVCLFAEGGYDMARSEPILCLP